MCPRGSPQPRPQGFSLTKWVGREKPHPFFKGKALGTRVVNREKVDCYTQMWAQMDDHCQTTFSTFAIQRSLGSLRSNDADDNENVKKTIGFISKTTTSHVHHTFLYFSFPFLHDYDVKMPNFAFYGGRKQATTKFYFSF